MMDYLAEALEGTRLYYLYLQAPVGKDEKEMHAVERWNHGKTSAHIEAVKSAAMALYCGLE